MFRSTCPATKPPPTNVRLAPSNTDGMTVGSSDVAIKFPAASKRNSVGDVSAWTQLPPTHVSPPEQQADPHTLCPAAQHVPFAHILAGQQTPPQFSFNWLPQHCPLTSASPQHIGACPT